MQPLVPLLSLVLALAPRAQEPAPAAAPTSESSPVPDAPTLWKRVCDASGSATRAPLTAFQIQAEVRTRSGAQSNDAAIDYCYLAPDCIRFMTTQKNVTGRFGPTPEQYWLKSPTGVVVLAGREFGNDRKLVDDMLALARNYVALSNPARLDLKALELATVPADLPPQLAKRARKLTWLALESPNFALVRSDAVRAKAALYRVELGVRGEDQLPAFAVIREKGEAPADPLLVEFSKYQQQDDFNLPTVLQVYVLDRSVAPVAFAEKPSQEVYVTSAALRPKFTVEDFKPRKEEKPH